MKLVYKYFLFLIIPVFLSTAVSLSHAVKIPQSPPGHVVDLAGVIDSTSEAKLDRYLRELESKTTAQFVVLTIKSLEGESIEDLSINIAHKKWKLGQKEKDNGLLLFVAVKERKYRIEVGYGLEGIIPDSLAGSIGRKVLVPFFRQGEYAKGIYTASVFMANIIADDAGCKITGMPEIAGSYNRQIRKQPVGLMGKIVPILFLIVMVILFIRNPKLFITLLLLSSMGGRRGGWGGGGGGGFSGGGGGFGGGGASGSW